MGTRIKFDSMGNIQEATLVLATRSGKKLGSIPAHDVVFKECLNSYSEVSFKVNKYDNGIECRLWNQIKNFKLVYCPEWDLWFEIKLDINESNDVSKSVSGKTICESELSQIMLYDIEINTETDISRDDYLEPTIIFNEESPESSLLNRIMEKAPHYRIISVDASVAKMQRTFSFDGTSLYDAFQQIAEEVGCLFVFGSGSDENGLPARTIEVRDLINSCRDCYYREENMTVCPKCGSQNIVSGYGSDTGIFVSTENLADEITYSTDTDSVKNCFKIEGGDDLINATVRNCNPNGTDYIWYISETVKEDMSDELVDKINAYDVEYSEYQNDKSINIDSTAVSKYNTLVTKYKSMYDAQNDEGLKSASSSIIGYPALMNLYYDVVDLSVYLQSGMMPSAETSGTTAEKQAALLTESTLSPVAVTSSTISKAAAENAILGLAKVYVKPSYQVKINQSSLSGWEWTGNFTVTNISDDEDTAESSKISITIDTDIETYVDQKMKKALKRSETDDLSIVGIFSLGTSDFKNELTKYSLDSLSIFDKACEGCLDVMIEQGYSSSDDSDTYAIYKDYYNKSKYIQSEMALREDEIEIISGVYNSDDVLVTYGIKNYIIDVRDTVQDALNFENYLGEDLWREFCVYRREDKYSNSNYISDGLNNAELFNKAKELFEVATKEIYKSAELQHSISGSLKNIFAMKEFKPLVESFVVGNWIRIKVDESVYKLRLISYEIDYSDFLNSSVEFSDVLKIATGISDVQSVLQQASSIASSYGAVSHQAGQGANGNKIVNNWVTKGLALTNSYISNSENQELRMDTNGFLMREWFPITETYSDKQLKIINKGLYITDDDWETSRMAVGTILYIDPETNEQKESYGVIADTIIGDLIISEKMGIYTATNNIILDEDGLTVTNGTNTVTINPDESKNVFTISNKSTDKFYISNSGNIYLDGSIYFTNEKKTNLKITDTALYFYNNESITAIIETDSIFEDSSTNLYDFPSLSMQLDKPNGYFYWGINDNDESYREVMAYYSKPFMSEVFGLNFEVFETSVFTSLYSRFQVEDDCVAVVNESPFIITEGSSVKLNEGSSLIAYNGCSLEFYSPLYMHGWEIYDTAIASTSDYRLKTNIVDADISATDLLSAIEMKSFDWVETGEHENIGIIAQQLEAIMPELVVTDDDSGIKRIKYSDFVPYLIKAIQEISEKVNLSSSAVSEQNLMTFNLGEANFTNKSQWVDDMNEDEKKKFVDKNKGKISRKRCHPESSLNVITPTDLTKATHPIKRRH